MKYILFHSSECLKDDDMDIMLNGLTDLTVSNVVYDIVRKYDCL